MHAQGCAGVQGVKEPGGRRSPLSGSDPAEEEIRVLTKDILFGMNLLTLVGFLVMGLSLTLHRTGNAGVPLSIGLMCAGTALVFFGFFAVSSSD
jgi:hypothetical protein